VVIFLSHDVPHLIELHAIDMIPLSVLGHVGLDGSQASVGVGSVRISQDGDASRLEGLDPGQEVRVQVRTRAIVRSDHRYDGYVRVSLMGIDDPRPGRSKIRVKRYDY